MVFKTNFYTGNDGYWEGLMTAKAERSLFISIIIHVIQFKVTSSKATICLYKMFKLDPPIPH